MFALCLVKRSWSSCSIWLFLDEVLTTPAFLDEVLATPALLDPVLTTPALLDPVLTTVGGLLALEPVLLIVGAGFDFTAFFIGLFRDFNGACVSLLAAKIAALLSYSAFLAFLYVYLFLMTRVAWVTKSFPS